MNKVSLIAALDLNHCIGNNGKLLKKDKYDLAKFKRLTQDNIIIMGANTFINDLECKPLPNRINIVLTKNRMGEIIKYDNVYPFESKERLSNYLNKYFQHRKIFIIGGSQIYSQFLNDCDRMYITYFYDVFEGDVYFSKVDWTEWKVENFSNFTDRNLVFVEYSRKS